MFTHHEHQSLGQDKSASPTVTRERCIPIKRRWLQKFDPSKGNRSSQPDCSSRSSSSGVFSETELPGNHFYEVEQSEALDFTRPRKSTSGHRLANQVSSKKSQVSLATNSTRSLYKRGFDTQSQSPLGDRSLKRFRHSSPSLQANQLTGTSYRLPSAVQARNSFGILANDQLNPRKYKEQDNLQTDFKFGSADRQAQARQQLQFQKPILEQCLRGCHLGSLPGRPTVRNVLRHQDHTKLSIGERTELDKMHYEEISAKYFNANFEKQPASELLHSASSVRRKAGTSSMMFDQDTHWNRLDSQGSSVSSSADTFIRSYGTTSGTTTSIQHQPYASQSETYHNSKMPQDVVMLENNMSTITVNELFNLVGVTQEFMSQDQTPSHSTDDQSDHLHQMGKGSRSIASKVDSRLENLKQPKAELMVDGLPSCQRSNGQFHHQPGAEISEEVSEHLHVVEELVSQNQTKVVKTEADSCTLPTNGKSSTPTTVIKREPGSRTKKPLDGKCPICTDVISGYHYGTHSCESCKGFFKRTIQNKRNERLACALIGNCVINLQNRKHCASCRFKKCLESGMKQEAVREDRQRGGRSMYEGSSEQQRRQHLQLQQEQKEALGQVKKRKPRKRASSTTTQPPDENGADQNLETTTRLPPQQTLRLSNPSTPCPVPTTSMITLSTSSRSSDSSDEGHQYLKTLESLEATFFNPFGLPRISVDRTNSEKSLLTGAYYLMDYFCKKMPLWIEMMPFLQDLEVFDRSVLLKANWLQVLVLTVCFRCHNNEGHLILPDRSTCDMMSMVTSVGILDIARRMKQLAQKFQALKTTQDEYFYLKLLILLNPDVKNLSQPSRIRRFQETVQEHLFDHGMAKEGIASGMKIGELLLKLSELQRLSHLIKEHLVFTQVAGRLGPRSYCNLENMLDD